MVWAFPDSLPSIQPSIMAFDLCPRLILSLLAPLISNLNWATVGTAVQQTDTMWSRSLKPLLERECELLLQRLEVAPHKVVRRPLPVCLVANERCRSLLHPVRSCPVVTTVEKNAASVARVCAHADFKLTPWIDDDAAE